MAWTDIVALILIASVAWMESHRGFGRSLFDVVGAIISLKVAELVSEMLTVAAPVLSSPNGTHAFWYSAVFLVLAVLTILGTKVIYDTTLLSLDVLDPLVGAIFGLISGLIVAHVFLNTLQLGYTGDDVTALLNTLMGEELLQFRTYHAIVTALQSLGNW
jgi:uncharacterized membrane protein required for colicin V production